MKLTPGTIVLIVGIVVLLAIVAGTDTTIDIGITLAALSFAATVGIARYVSEGRIF
ncbi:MAG: monovalent cation/H+ antiporter complex subunit F [Chloroflexota bacterium]